MGQKNGLTFTGKSAERRFSAKTQFEVCLELRYFLERSLENGRESSLGPTPKVPRDLGSGYSAEKRPSSAKFPDCEPRLAERVRDRTDRMPARIQDCSWPMGSPRCKCR